MRKIPDLQLAFDVGHSSIGWAVLQNTSSTKSRSPDPKVLGTGVVTFGTDDCLAVKRRKNRQARRHARSTRQRIARMEQLLAHLGVMAAAEIKARHEQAGGDSFAWRMAAEILAAARAGKPLPTLGWPELWDILRWYAHNRGYFAPPWANRGDDAAADDDDVPDTEKVANAHAIMKELNTRTMAESIAAYTIRYEREVAAWQQGKLKEKPRHFKGLNAAFERKDVVWPEVRNLLTALKGKLPQLDDAFIRTMIGGDVDPLNTSAEQQAWNTISCGLKLPKRYYGGLLFGQMIPRFDNRIIGVCPIYFARRHAELLASGCSAEDAKHGAAKESKLPSKATAEFLRYRWSLQLANVFGASARENTTRTLTVEERAKVTAQAAYQGSLGKKEFEKIIHEVAGWNRSNIANMLMHPDAEKALVLDPVRREITNSKLADALATLPDQFRKRLQGKLARGKSLTVSEVRDWLDTADGATFDAAVQRVLDAANTKKTKKQSVTTREELLSEKLKADLPKGRAPYARPVLRQVYEEVMKGWDPRAEKNQEQPRGCLCQTNELREAQLQRRVEEQTNNHLIRHRLLILERLQADLIAAPEFAAGDKGRIAGMTIEVASELRDLSGKTRKEQEQDLGIRLGDFKRVAALVEDYCRPRGILVTAGLIRKARLASDQGWKCPYTDKTFELQNIINGDMEKDHIIPHADRQSDSLDSMVITWKEVNAMKKKRTAWQFIQESKACVVAGRPQLTLLPLEKYKELVNGLKPKRNQGHADDRARKERRVRRLLTENYEEKEFTPRDLTVTRHLVRMGAQVLQRNFPPEQRPPVVSLPGSVTGEVRKAWKLTGCLGAANPAIFEADGKTPKRKDDIRGITHLHHALDACVMGLASLYFPRHGTFWATMVKAGADREADDERRLWLAMTRRRPTAEEATLLKATGLYKADREGRMRLDDLPDSLKEQIRQRLAEKRVVEHVPSDVSGLGKRVTQNTSGILEVIDRDGIVLWKRGQPIEVLNRLRSREDVTLKLSAVIETSEGEGGEISSKPVLKPVGTAFGFSPTSKDGKLTKQLGVRFIRDNFGVALLGKPGTGEFKAVMVPWCLVWKQLERLRVANGGQWPTVVRKGHLLRVQEGDLAGVWRVMEMSSDKSGKIVCELGQPDTVTLRTIEKDASGKAIRKTMPGCKRAVSFERLAKSGFQVVRSGLIGVSAR